MSESTECIPRIRINAKETSKGEWYFEGTVETTNVEGASSLLIEAVKTTQRKFREAGKKIVEDAG